MSDRFTFDAGVGMGPSTKAAEINAELSKVKVNLGLAQDAALIARMRTDIRAEEIQQCRKNINTAILALENVERMIRASGKPPKLEVVRT